MTTDLFLPLLLILTFAELLVIYRWPAVLARFAVLPAGVRQVALPARAAEAMTVHGPPATAYRSPPASALDLARLGVLPRVDAWGSTMFFAPARGRFLARNPWTVRSSARPLVRVDVTALEDRIVLRARYYPTVVLPLIVASVAGCLEERSAGPLWLLAIAALALVQGFRESRTHVAAATTEVSVRVLALEQAGGARIAGEGAAPGAQGALLAAAGPSNQDAHAPANQAVRARSSAG